jgi:hypothetical protein
VASEPNQAWRIEKRIFLQRLWEELQQLPLNQRAALLLNLRDATGFSCITLFPATGIATIRQLAEALEISAESFAEVWNDLPLEDARIAELLGLTRQQVIYLIAMVIRSKFRQLISVKPTGTPVWEQRIQWNI